ncbi:MAG: glycosyltransferase [Muribaculaceae bacterium]|nr:glycosyltransferase [Muribaculaceae bacterium]
MGKPLKIVIINKSDSTGGAAIVSRRLMEALRQQGADARMLVAEKLSDSPYVELAASPSKIKASFLAERLKIFVANGFNRTTLFKIDTASEGLPLWKHPLVINADAILLNWVNQGMLSLNGIKKILELNKPVIWTMHDMWCMTGICHHAGSCNHYHNVCGECPLLGMKAAKHDLSFKIRKKKSELFNSDVFISNPITFVAVSSWLANKSRESSLLSDQRVEVIHNAFKADKLEERLPLDKNSRIRILFGAARLDDPIKGLDTLRELSSVISKNHPQLASRMEIALFGDVKNPESLKGFSLPLVNLGVLRSEDKVKEAYLSSQILVSASSYETLPGTLVEAQAYGVIPVAFSRGGQSDIVDHLSTGYLARYDEDISRRAMNLAEGIIRAADILNEPEEYQKVLRKMFESVVSKFSYENIALKYIELIKEMS